MALIAILTFIGIFAVVAPLLVVGSGAGNANEKKQTLATLDSAIGVKPEDRPETMASFRKNEAASAIPWLNRRLENLEIAPRLRLFISQADMKWTPGGLILMSLGCFGAAAYLVDLRTGSIWISLAIGLALSLAPFGYVWAKRRTRFGKFEQGLPEALDLMVSALRVGHSFTAAMGLVTRECPDPVGSEFRIAFEEQNFGLDLRTALDHLTTRLPLQDLKIACTAILIQRESGGNLAEVLEKTAYVIRQRFRLRRQVMVHTAQGRLTGWILTILPVALGIGLYIVNPETMSLLWKREIGVKLLCAGAGSLVVGSLLIQKIVRLDV
jgi:tight adherence protein B